MENNLKFLNYIFFDDFKISENHLFHTTTCNFFVSIYKVDAPHNNLLQLQVTDEMHLKIFTTTKYNINVM